MDPTLFNSYLKESQKHREDEFDALLRKYEDKSLKSDVIDLEKMEIVEDNGYLANSKGNRNFGFLTSYSISDKCKKIKKVMVKQLIKEKAASIKSVRNKSATFSKNKNYILKRLGLNESSSRLFYNLQNSTTSFDAPKYENVNNNLRITRKSNRIIKSRKFDLNNNNASNSKNKIVNENQQKNNLNSLNDELLSKTNKNYEQDFNIKFNESNRINVDCVDKKRMKKYVNKVSGNSQYLAKINKKLTNIHHESNVISKIPVCDIIRIKNKSLPNELNSKKLDIHHESNTMLKISCESILVKSTEEYSKDLKLTSIKLISKKKLEKIDERKIKPSQKSLHSYNLRSRLQNKQSNVKT